MILAPLLEPVAAIEIVPAESADAAFRADPDMVTVADQRPNPHTNQSIAGRVPVPVAFAAIVSEESIVSSDPHDAVINQKRYQIGIAENGIAVMDCALIIVQVHNHHTVVAYCV